MVEREHFTNGRCLALGTGLALMGASFSAQVGGWQHWTSIGVGYGSGFLLVTLAVVLITKSYYSRHSESVDSTLSTPPLRPESKLKIRSAFYGVDGKQDIDVRQILEHKIQGNALVLFIENDEFGPDPVFGVEKRLRVRYSFNSNRVEEVVRHEHDLMVLPEDSRLKQGTLVQLPPWYGYANEQAWRDAIAEQNRLLDLGRKVDGFSQLQMDALRLSADLLDFLKRIGHVPAPRYSRNQIFGMSFDETRRLIEAQDGDFSEACAFHEGDNRIFPITGETLYRGMAHRHTRLVPWYEKLRASYALEFKTRVEEIHNRFAVEGLSDAGLLLAVEYFDGLKNVRSIAALLWTLAYKLEEKNADQTI